MKGDRQTRRQIRIVCGRSGRVEGKGVAHPDRESTVSLAGMKV